MDMYSDEYDRLMLQLAKKERSSFETLYQKLKNQVYGLALAILKNRDDASDVMQNVFIQVWEAAPQYRPGTDARAWVMKITRNLALYHLRKNKHNIVFEEYQVTNPSEHKVSEALDKLVLRELLNMLDKDERQIVMLYSLCGYTQKEISNIMGKPYATIRWKFSNAMKKLSNIVEEETYHE
jgi:RNA polymerase sigma-70 factor (ECF subfamily)